MHVAYLVADHLIHTHGVVIFTIFTIVIVIVIERGSR